MKKFSFAVAALIAAATFSSCGNGTPSASLKDDVDTISYAVGVAQSEGVKEYLSQRLGIDTAYVDEFLKGVTEGATAGDDKKKAAYYAGIQIGQQFGTQMVSGLNHELFGNDSTRTVSLKNILAGFAAGAKGTAIMNSMEAQQTLQKKMEVIKAEAMEKQFGEYKKENEAYLAKNAKADGVVTLPSGVQYKVINAGSGEPVAKDTSLVVVHYEGKTIDGQVFDSSYKREKPAEMRANQVIPGWREILTKMPKGAKWEVAIPQELAYGANGQGQVIKPFSTLLFTIELINVK